MKNQYSIDEINAADRIIQSIKRGNGFDQAFSEVAYKFDLSKKEMDNVEYIISKKYKQKK